MVDALNLPARLADSPEAQNQIAFADVIVLNKTDLVDAAGLQAVEARIRGINRVAAIHRAQRGKVAVGDLLDQGGFDLQRALENAPDFLESESHSHDESVQSLSFEVDEPLDPGKFQAWIGAVLQEQGPNILRSKGILSYAGEHRRFAFQAVHMMADGDFIGSWKEGEPRRSRLVFIGRDLNRPRLRRGFESCRASRAA